MSLLTAFLGLRKPEGPDLVNVTTDIANNMDLIDTFLSSLMPLGSVLPYTGAAAPGGKWHIADGSLKLQVDYPDYFALIGHTFNGGVDPGGGQFKFPLITDRGLIGAGATARGATKALSTVAEAQEHTHTANHDHTGSSVGEAQEHTHGIGGSTGGMNNGNPSGDHTHDYLRGGDISVLGTTVGSVGSGYNLAHGHDLPAGTGGRSAQHSHGITVDTKNFSTGGRSATHTHVIDGGTALALPFIIRVLK